MSVNILTFPIMTSTRNALQFRLKNMYIHVACKKVVVVGIHRQESGVPSVCGTSDDDDDGQVEQAEDAKQDIMLGDGKVCLGRCESWSCILLICYHTYVIPTSTIARLWFHLKCGNRWMMTVPGTPHLALATIPGRKWCLSKIIVQ